jgi:multisubunit Na+/H+ antiporter MnhB subunit
LGLIMLAALAALESRHMRFSVMAFGLAGFGFCLVYVLLGSWDLALVQLAVELALLAYLIFSAGPSADLDSNADEQIALYPGIIIFALIFTGFAYLIFKTWPIVNIFQSGVKLPGVFELVGIVAALLAAIVGALTVLRPEGRE